MNTTPEDDQRGREPIPDCVSTLELQLEEARQQREYTKQITAELRGNIERLLAEVKEWQKSEHPKAYVAGDSLPYDELVDAATDLLKKPTQPMRPFSNPVSRRRGEDGRWEFSR